MKATIILCQSARLRLPVLFLTSKINKIAVEIALNGHQPQFFSRTIL